MFSLLFALSAPTHAPTWEADTLEIPTTLDGIEVVTTEFDGWIRRTASRGAEGYGLSAGVSPDPMGAAEAAPVRHRAEKRRSGPSRPTSGEAEDFAPPSGRPAAPPMNAPSLKAGTTDDNAHFGEFLEFVATWKDKPGIAGEHVELDVANRASIHVQGAHGQPLPGARVSVLQGDRRVWSGTTYGDGAAPFYPGLLDVETGDFLVQVQHGGLTTEASWNGSDSLSFSLGHQVESVVDLDVVFVIDTTGSMSDEIDRIKQTLLTVTARVQQLDTPVNLRYGAVLYRDIGDEYLTQHTALTPDLEGFDRKLQQISAGGGGDGPESLNQGLAIAVGEMDWRDDAAKLVFLVADAQPHMDYEGDVTYAEVSQAALSQGIRIHTVAASGLQDFGSLVFRQTAQLSRGQFIFIEYGNVAASAADHGVTGPVSSNNLDDILLRQITREIEGWGQGTVAKR